VRPALCSVYFGDRTGQYPRLAAVLAHTARVHCPAWDVTVREIQPPTARAATGSTSHAANHHKLIEWAHAVRDAQDGQRLVLVDADTFITGPLDPLWDLPFDFAYTTREAARYPLNAGVIAVRVGPAVRRWMEAWLAVDAAFLRDAADGFPWRQRYGGQNQASLGATLESGLIDDLGLTVAALPCREWNCEDSAWAEFDPTLTKIVHVKSALRMDAFDKHRSPHTRQLAVMWKALDLGIRDVRLEATA
jgi:hypothetical protein